MPVRENILALRHSLPATVTLVAVSKTQPVTALAEAYAAGQRIFGENRVQEMTAKRPQLPGDVEWHFIGHLQTNKVKYIAPFVSLIHSIESLNLLAEVNRQAAKHGRVIDCLLQFHIATEETKFGLDLREARNLLSSREVAEMMHVRIIGVMGMNSYSGDTGLIRRECRELADIFRTLRTEYFSDAPSFREISMGMSGDYPIAVEEGSTLVRLGTVIFGPRQSGLSLENHG